MPVWASDKLCRDVLVEMICLLRGSREDVEKSAPSQLLQGVLQCRGLTENWKVKGSLPDTQLLTLFIHLPAAMPHFFSPTLYLFFICIFLYPHSLTLQKKKKQRELKAPYGHSWLCTSLFRCIGVGQTGWSFFYPESLASQYRRTVCSSISQFLK